MGSESGSILRGVFSISYCKVGSLPLSSFCAFPRFLPQLSFLAVFLQPSIGAQSVGALPCRVLVLMSGALSCLCAQEGDVGAEQQDHSSWSSCSSPRTSCPVPLCPINQHIQHPWPLLWVTCHRFVKQTGHLGREAAAVLLPGVPGICSLHTHTGCLYLTDNYLTKYANSIITVICLAVISV